MLLRNLRKPSYGISVPFFRVVDDVSLLVVVFLFPVPLGSIPELPAETCKEMKASERKAVSGKYWLSNIKPGMAVLAHCDMKTEGRFFC